MARLEHPVTIEVDDRTGQQLASTGGRFSFGLYLRLRGRTGDQVIAWLPTTSRKSPPRFFGQVDDRGDGRILRGVIRETRFEALQGWFWGGLAGLFLVITVGMGIAATKGTGTAWWGVVVFGAAALCFTVFAKTFSHGRAEAFDRDAHELQDQLHAWATDPA